MILLFREIFVHELIRHGGDGRLEGDTLQPGPPPHKCPQSFP